MAHSKEVELKLKNLPIGEYKLVDLIKIIVDADQFQKEGLFDNGPYGRNTNRGFDDIFYKESIIKELKSYFPKGLEDLWIDITYQRVLRLQKLISHLKRKDMKGTSLLYFNSMVCGSVDIIVRPDGKGFVWDGLRRCLIALLHGKRFIKTSIEEHDKDRSIEDCKSIEAFAFKIKNGFAERMLNEELYKSGLVYGDADANKLYDVIVEMGVDVLGTNPGGPQLGAFSEFQDTVLKEKLSNTFYLVQAAWKQKNAWKNPSVLTGYVLCGLAKFLDVNENPYVNGKLTDEDSDLLSFRFHTAHPNTNNTCEVEEALIEYAKTHNQNHLCSNRLAGKSIESVAYNIGRVVMGLSAENLFILASALGFAEDDAQSLNIIPLTKSSKSISV